MTKREVKMNFHHSLMMVLGLRKQELCPECNSDTWHRALVFDRCDTIFTGGYEIEGSLDYSYSKYCCNECSHETEGY